MPQISDRKQKLIDLFEEGVIIFKTNNLYGLVDHIPKNDEPDFDQNFSFIQYVKQNYIFPNYSPWYEKLIKYFDNFNLNFTLLEKKIYDVDRRKQSVMPAAVFKRTLDELERLISDPGYFSAFETTSKRPVLHHEVEFNNGTISQGYGNHKFHDDRAIRMLSYLWDDREFVRPDKSIFKEGKLVPFDMAMKELKVNSLDGIRSTADAINKSARGKKIGLRVRLPRKKDGIKLEVTQDSH